ncbi:MAG TPA: hypothetical protein VK541_17430 [Pedobacter sp.]|uniref:hypothetical protein n=1 Tax=Pedobacter sp. TaxID=1411316 RepID=UPI002C050136|nr:hypothetical protein [Pedobacter sp.]HMI04274.1 hypothetical protein [Pedobacter sp.]
MPLDTLTLKAAIKEAFDFESDKDVNPAEARERQAHKIALAIEVFVKSGQVNVIVAGTAGTGNVI